MVKKLFKHEIASYKRIILPMHLILVAIAIVSRVVQLFDDNSTTYNIIFGSTTTIFVIACIVCVVLTIIYCIKRFYTNFFSHEGYLTFTLPVSTTQHLLTKVTVAVMVQLFSIVMILVACCTITFGDVCVEVFKAIGYIIGDIYNEVGINLIFHFIEIFFCLIVALGSSSLLFYACISIGQRANKNRVAWAVGVYFIYYAAFQLIGTAIIIFINAVSDTQWFIVLTGYFFESGSRFLHYLLCGYIVYQLVLGTVFYYISKRTISKKLNLE